MRHELYIRIYVPYASFFVSLYTLGNITSPYNSGLPALQIINTVCLKKLCGFVRSSPIAVLESSYDRLKQPFCCLDAVATMGQSNHLKLVS
jgi:hypothetical protein